MAQRELVARIEARLPDGWAGSAKTRRAGPRVRTAGSDGHVQRSIFTSSFFWNDLGLELRHPKLWPKSRSLARKVRDFTLVDLGQAHNVKGNVWEGLMTFYPTWITAAIVFGGIT